MVTISKLGKEVDQVSIKINGKLYILSEKSNKFELYKAVKELSRVLLAYNLIESGHSK